MANSKRRLLEMGLPFLLVFLLDASLTLHEQPVEYWAGNYAWANEVSPYFRSLLVIHPIAFIVGALVWVGLILELLVLLPEVLAAILFIFVVFGHTNGAYSWIALDITVGRYQLGMVTNLVRGYTESLFLPRILENKGVTPANGQRGAGSCANVIPPT